MARDKTVYFGKMSKAGNRSETTNQQVIVEVLIDLLDAMDDVLQELKDIKEVLQGT